MTGVLASGVSLVLVALLLGTLPLQAGSFPAKAELLENGAYVGALLDRIRAARKRVICVSYLFRIGASAGNRPRAVARELIAARRRGVEVTVILEGGKPVGAENRATARLLSRGGVRVLFPAGGVTTHAKAVVIDDRYLLIGSHNLTQSALRYNNELSMELDSPRLAAKVRQYLKQLEQ